MSSPDLYNAATDINSSNLCSSLKLELYVAELNRRLGYLNKRFFYRMERIEHKNSRTNLSGGNPVDISAVMNNV